VGRDRCPGEGGVATSVQKATLRLPGNDEGLSQSWLSPSFNWRTETKHGVARKISLGCSYCQGWHIAGVVLGQTLLMD